MRWLMKILDQNQPGLTCEGIFKRTLRLKSGRFNLKRNGFLVLVLALLFTPDGLAGNKAPKLGKNSGAVQSGGAGGNDALFMAAEKGQSEVVAALLDAKKANVNE